MSAGFKAFHASGSRGHSNAFAGMPPQAHSFAPNPMNNFVSPRVSQGDLLRKEQRLGVIREIAPPEDHIGLSLFPFLNVASDDVIFDYTKGLTTGLAPARAENAESELAQKDVGFAGQGSASIIDWALKDYYDANDVQRYRDLLSMAEQAQNGILPMSLQSDFNDLPAKQAADQALRVRKLHNRFEKLIMDSLAEGKVGYNDGKVNFGIDWGRPEDQHEIAADWSGTDFDPIAEINSIIRKAYNLYGIRLRRAITSNRVLNAIVNSEKWGLRAGFGPSGGVTNSDLPYVLDGWGPRAAVEALQNQTQIQFIEYDSGYRTNSIGSNSIKFNRYTPEDVIIFLPDDSQIAEYDSSPIGFGKTLTSPHVMGNNSPGFYEWEDYTTDPWAQTRGTGIKALPIFPHMELSYTMKIDLPPEP